MKNVKIFFHELFLISWLIPNKLVLPNYCFNYFFKHYYISISTKNNILCLCSHSNRNHWTVQRLIYASDECRDESGPHQISLLTLSESRLSVQLLFILRKCIIIVTGKKNASKEDETRFVRHHLCRQPPPVCTDKTKLFKVVPWQHVADQ